MGSKLFKWCPNGCGKKVVFDRYVRYLEEGVSIYKCMKCNKEFNKEDVEQIRTNKIGVI